MDNVASSSADAAPLFAMSGDGTEDVQIPLVFLYSSDADLLMKALKEDPQLQVTLAESSPDEGFFFALQTPLVLILKAIFPSPAVEDANLSEVRLDEEDAELLQSSSSVLPPSPDDAHVEKLRSEVRRIVVERMKEEAELVQKKKQTHDTIETRAKGTFIIRMDEKGAIVTEPVDNIALDSRLESYSDDDAAEAEAEEKRIRRAFITLLRMTVHLLLALQQDEKQEQLPVSSQNLDLSVLSDDVRSALDKVFASNHADIEQGLSRRWIEEVLASFRLLWPENILPRRHFAQMEEVLLALARQSSDSSPPLPSTEESSPSSTSTKAERLMQFMRSIRGEFATHLRQFYSKVADRSGLMKADAAETKPNRSPDEL